MITQNRNREAPIYWRNFIFFAREKIYKIKINFLFARYLENEKEFEEKDKIIHRNVFLIKLNQILPCIHL